MGFIFVIRPSVQQQLQLRITELYIFICSVSSRHSAAPVLQFQVPKVSSALYNLNMYNLMKLLFAQLHVASECYSIERPQRHHCIYNS